MLHSASRRIAVATGVAMVVLALAVPSAMASSSAIYQACANGGSLSGFSKSDLQAALGGVPADLDEYYACSAQINAALVDKATKNVPGGGKGVKGTKAKLRNANANDLTTPAQRAKFKSQVENETKLDPKHPFDGSQGDPSIKAAAGNTLASAAAPGSPTALIIGVIGLLVLLGADLAGRVAKIPRVNKNAPDSEQRDGDA